MSEFYGDWSQEEEQRQIEVFGIERIESTKGHEASPEESKQLLNAIVTLCDEEKAQQYRGMLCRTFLPPDQSGQKLFLAAGMHGRTIGFDKFSNMDNALAIIDYIGYKEERLKRPGLFRMSRKYAVREGIFVDSSEVAMVQKEILPVRRGHEAGQIATKLATSAEVEEALNTLANAVHYEEKFEANNPSK